MAIKNNHKRFISIFILMLFIFQNAWAVEQSYRMVCPIIEAGSEKQSVNHEHKNCVECCHINTSLVTVLQSNFYDYLSKDNFYRHYTFIQFYSVFIQPPLPPPIV